MPRFFDAIDALQGLSDHDLTLCLFLDGCTDASLTLATDYHRRAPIDVAIGVALPSPSNAGAARAAAMKMGLDRIGNGEGVLLTTDADSRPQADWITTMMAALDHADVVSGRVVRGDRRPSVDQDRISAYYDRLFTFRRQIDPVRWEASPTHHQISGANMGMYAATYTAIGGFLPLPNGEDARFADDAARAGFRVRRDAASMVLTSDRRDGRATGGLADMLRDLEHGGISAVTVAHPDDQLWQYRMHALARSGFEQADFASLGVAIDLSDDHLLGVARDCPNAEAFAMRVVPVPPGGMRHIALPAAEEALTALQQISVPAEAA